MKSILIIIVAYFFIPCISIAAQPIDRQHDTSLLAREKKNSKTTRSQDSEESLDFSGTGRPGQQTAGESRGSCANTSDSLKALMPVSHSGKTVKGHPSFWVYFPYTSQQVSKVEFILQNEVREDIWRSPVELDSNPGYKNFSLPKTEPPLEIGQWYRWYVKVYCNSQVASSQYVQGWVNRVPLTSKLYLETQKDAQKSHLIYGSYGIWYDAIDKLLSLYQQNPCNLTLERDWQNLTKAKGVQLEQLPKVKASFEPVKPLTIN